MIRLRKAVPAALIAALASCGAIAQEDAPAHPAPKPVAQTPVIESLPQKSSESPLVQERAENRMRPYVQSSATRVPESSPEVDPEVAIAEAQVREAEARLRQARIAAAQREIEMEQVKRIVELARKNAEEQQNRAQMGIGTQQEYMEAQERLARAEAEAAKLDAASQVMGSRGGSAHSAFFGGFEQPRFPAPRPEMSPDDTSDVAIALQSPVAIEFKDATLREIAEKIGEYVGVNIVLDVGLHAADEAVTIKLTDVPLKDGLLALADAYGDLCFVVRDYGVFATTMERAVTISAPTIPANVPLLVSFQDASNRGLAVGMFGGGGFGGGFGMGGGPAAGGGGFGRGNGPATGGGLGGDFGSLDGPGAASGGFGGGGGIVPGSTPGGLPAGTEPPANSSQEPRTE